MIESSSLYTWATLNFVSLRYAGPMRCLIWLECPEGNLINGLLKHFGNTTTATMHRSVYHIQILQYIVLYRDTQFCTQMKGEWSSSVCFLVSPICAFQLAASMRWWWYRSERVNCIMTQSYATNWCSAPWRRGRMSTLLTKRCVGAVRVSPKRSVPIDRCSGSIAVRPAYYLKFAHVTSAGSVFALSVVV